MLRKYGSIQGSQLARYSLGSKKEGSKPVYKQLPIAAYFVGVPYFKVYIIMKLLLLLKCQFGVWPVLKKHFLRKFLKFISCICCIINYYHLGLSFG